MANHLYAIHDFSDSWASIVKNKNRTGWTVISEEIGDDPDNHSGQNYSGLVNFNITPIVRLNYSHHGQGTIPNRYNEFAQRCANFVSASQGCTLWQIGNEPNLFGERVNNIPVLPHLYMDCYQKCRNAIKQRGTQHKVLIAPVAPYNVDTGPWMEYWAKMLETLDSPEETDGFTLHFYSRGSDPSSVFSNDKMDPPYQRYSNGFRAYRDFLNAIPMPFRHLPVFGTETDQIVAWEDRNTGWVKAAYQEIDDWNKQSWTQKILCLALYRWENFDQWGINGKNGVVQDFSEAIDRDYPSPVISTKEQDKIFMPKLVIDYTSPKGIVRAQLLNVRDAPGVSGTTIIGSRSIDDQVDILEERTVGSTIWYRIGDSQWVIAEWVKKTGENKLEDNWSRCLAFILKWEGGWADDPQDVGGATMKGITIGTYTKWRKERGEPEPTKDDLRNIPDSVVEAIYHDWYWIPSKAYQMPWPMCLAVVDLAVNGGVGRAEEAFNATGLDFWDYMLWRRDWYRSLSQFPIFGKAWINRCEDLVLTAYQS
jgi:glycosyl hydrolase family 108